MSERSLALKATANILAAVDEYLAEGGVPLTPDQKRVLDLALGIDGHSIDASDQARALAATKATA